MPGGIFLIQNDNELVELAQKEYDSEALLQQLLARYPNLLVGDQIDESEPRRWLLVTREAAVPGELNGAGRWSLDHLFLDQDGIPTLVEVKRSTDTRIRREVVGQMLDYASNCVVYWPVETIRAMYEARCERENIDPLAHLGEVFGPESSAEAFWQQVKTNLQAARIRMVFVADDIPPELRRTVEFLNSQMDPAEVLAVEVKQYIGGAFRGLVPRVLGQTEQSNRRKGAPPSAASGRQWDEAMFMQAIAERSGEEAARVAQRLLAWAQAESLRVGWGKGAQDGSFFVNVAREGQKLFAFSAWTSGTVEVEFQNIVRDPVAGAEKVRREARRRLEEIPGVKIPDERLTKRPTFPITRLAAERAFAIFCDVMLWLGRRED